MSAMSSTATTLVFGDDLDRRFGFPFQSAHRCANQNDQIKKTKSHVALLFLPEGVGSNETKGDLFTMSKYPALER